MKRAPTYLLLLIVPLLGSTPAAAQLLPRQSALQAGIGAGALVGLGAARWAGHWSHAHHDTAPALWAARGRVGVGLSLATGGH